MERTKLVRRRRWGASGLTSLGAHLALVLVCVVAAGPRYERVNGRSGVHEATEAAIDFDLVPAAEAAPLPEPALVEQTPAVTSGARRAHAFHRPRPALAAASAATMTSQGGSNPLEPPPFSPTGSLEDAAGPVGQTAALEVAAASAGAAVATAAVPDVPVVSASEAGYLRTYETYPSLPRSLRVWGRVYTVLAQICVGTDGAVTGVAIKRGAAAELDRSVSATMRSWRYQPRKVDGVARPFCHLIQVDFSLR
jgi:TonB family protein